MASKSNQKQAQRMAEQGKSASQIQKSTGVSAQKATNLVSKAAPSIQAYQANQQAVKSTPQVGQRPGETATVYAPGVTPPAQQSQGSSNNTPNAIADGRYGLGVQKAAAQNYKGLVAQGNTDAFNPGKPGSRMNIMADGFVGRKELNKFANLKDIDASQARKRLSSKGAAFTAGANKRADAVFGKNNPFLSMMIGSGSGYEGLISAAQSPGKARQMQITKDSRAFDYKNRLPDEVFRFRPESGMQGDRPMPNMERLNQIFGNPIVGDKPPGGDPPPDPKVEPGDPMDPVVTAEPEKPEEQPLDPGQGMMAGGGLGAAGAAKLGRARSRLQRLGILGRGTGLFGRGLQYGNSLNA
jgi:hypothetical protein